MDIIPRMTNSQLDLRQYDWFALFRDSLDDEDREQLDALVVRVNDHQASIATAGHPFPNYVVMLAFMLEEHYELKRLKRKIAKLGLR